MNETDGKRILGALALNQFMYPALDLSKSLTSSIRRSLGIGTFCEKYVTFGKKNAIPLSAMTVAGLSFPKARLQTL